MAYFSKTAIHSVYQLLKENLSFPFDLKDGQMSSLFNVVNQIHTLAILPTGYGKSEIFILVPLVLDYLQPGRRHFSLVVLPLISLVTDMRHRFSGRSVNITDLTATNMKDAAFVNEINEGLYSTIMIAPEYLENASNMDFLTESSLYQEGIACVAIDEAHLIVQWG